MKTIYLKCACLAGALGLGVLTLPAQETNEVEQLKRQFEELKQNFERVTAEQRKIIEALQQRVDDLQVREATNMPPATLQPPPAEVATLPTPEVEQTWSPTSPIRVGSGGSYVDISLVSTFAAGGSTANDIDGGLELGGHDPKQNGFTVQGVELNLQGAVDPYFRGNANIAFQIDQNGETSTEVEEAWMETLSMPLNLQTRAGQYLTSFGRINTQHPHT